MISYSIDISILQHVVSGVEPLSGVVFWSVCVCGFFLNIVPSPLKQKDDLFMATYIFMDSL